MSNVTLGYLGKQVKTSDRLFSDIYGYKFGGSPIFPEICNKFKAPDCPNCKLEQILIFQANTSYTDATDRFSYVFGCLRSLECSTDSDCWTHVRMKVSRRKTLKEASPADIIPSTLDTLYKTLDFSRSPIPQSTPTDPFKEAATDLFASVTDDPFASVLPDPFAAVSNDPFSFKREAETKIDVNFREKIPMSDEKKFAISSDSNQSLKDYFTCFVVERDFEPLLEDDLSERAKALDAYERFKIACENEGVAVMDTEMGEEVPQNLILDASSDFSDGDVSDSDDEGLFPITPVDPKLAVKRNGGLFNRFHTRVGRAPSQVLRYEFNGKPLFQETIPNPKSITCNKCKSPLTFEFQIMPAFWLQAIEKGNWPKTIDTGVVVCFCCKNDCGDDGAFIDKIIVQGQL